jgi:hypothetical protein
VNAKPLPTRPGTTVNAVNRLRRAEEHLDTARLVQDEERFINVATGQAVLAGIAAADAICLSAIGQRYSGTNHTAAADLLERVSKQDAVSLRRLIALKTEAHYGESLLNAAKRDRAIATAEKLVSSARERLVSQS